QPAKQSAPDEAPERQEEGFGGREAAFEGAQQQRKGHRNQFEGPERGQSHHLFSTLIDFGFVERIQNGESLLYAFRNHCPARLPLSRTLRHSSDGPPSTRQWPWSSFESPRLLRTGGPPPAEDPAVSDRAAPPAAVGFDAAARAHRIHPARSASGRRFATPVHRGCGVGNLRRVRI